MTKRRPGPDAPGSANPQAAPFLVAKLSGRDGYAGIRARIPSLARSPRADPLTGYTIIVR